MFICGAVSTVMLVPGAITLLPYRDRIIGRATPVLAETVEPGLPFKMLLPEDEVSDCKRRKPPNNGMPTEGGAARTKVFQRVKKKIFPL